MESLDFSLIQELKARGAVVLADNQVHPPHKGYTGHIKLRYTLFKENKIDPTKRYTVVLVME